MRGRRGKRRRKGKEREGAWETLHSVPYPHEQKLFQSMSQKTYAPTPPKSYRKF